MTIAEMHVWFRQYAQQMGMQNVRAILPEQIDLVINTSITDTVNQIITQNIGLTNDRIITDNSKIGQINALRSLYQVKVVDNISEIFTEGNESYIKRLYKSIEDFNSGTQDKYYKIDLNDQVEPNVVETYNATESEYTNDKNAKLITVYSEKDVDAYLTSSNIGNYVVVREKFDYLYLVDLSINYATDDKKLTNFFPVRIIDDVYLADTLNDFVLRPRFRTPVAVIYNNQLDLYIDTLEGNTANKHLPYSLIPQQLRVSYIGKPAKVKYLSDIGGEDIHCDLPDYMHVDILKHAVDLYNISIQGGMYAAQQQQQAQNREMSRNVARPNNEGYQS